MPIRRTCGTHASWLIAFPLALLMLSVAIASASAHDHSSLSNPQVSPRDTTFGTAIDFSVTFTDETGAAPRSLQLQIGDSVRDMTPASNDYRHGVRFTLSVAVSVGWHPVNFTVAPAQGDRQVALAGAVMVHQAQATPTPTASPRPTVTPTASPKPTVTSTASPRPTTSSNPSVPPSSGASGGAGGSGAPGSGAISPTQAPASQSAQPTSGTGSVGSSNPTPPQSSPKADPSARVTAKIPAGPVITPTRPAATASHPTATPSPSGAAGSQGAAANDGLASGGQPSDAAGDVSVSGGQSIDGAGGSGSSGGTSGHGPGLIEVARGGSGAGNTSVASYLLVNYHAPLSQLIVDLAPSISTAAGGTAAWAAFVLFGKRRRDGASADPDSTLATAAATGLEIGAGQGLTAVDESLLPRWRRPSLQQVRRTDPLRAVAETPSLSFAASGMETGDGYERRQIRYRLVRLLDSPDELRSAEIGVLDRGDEVLLLERRGGYWLVLCPDGRQGWVHRMTLSDPTQEDAPEVVPWEDPAMADYAFTDSAPVESILEEPSAAESEPAEQGFLQEYMQARSDALRSRAATQAEQQAEPTAEAVASAAPASVPVVASTVPVSGPSTDAAPAGEPGCAGERCSGRKTAGTRKAATGSRPGTKSRRPSR